MVISHFDTQGNINNIFITYIKKKSFKRKNNKNKVGLSCVKLSIGWSIDDGSTSMSGLISLSVSQSVHFYFSKLT